MSLGNYTPAGDIAVIAICCVFVILLTTSFVSRTRSFRIFMNIIGLLAGAAAVNITANGLMAGNNPSVYTLAYSLRILYHGLLFDVFFLFTLYTVVVSGMEHRQARLTAIISTVLLVGVVELDIFWTFTGTGLRIAGTGLEINRVNLFTVGYILYIILLAALLTRVRRLLYKRVMYGFYGTMAVSVLLQFGQLFFTNMEET